MNELLFFAHASLVILFVMIARKMGKETLIVWIALQAVLANFFILKQMSLFGFNVTCSDVFAIGSIASLNLLQEYHGKESARKAIWISFFALLFFALMSQLHLLYLPSSSDTAHSSYSALLTVTPRLLIASMATFVLVQQADIRFFAILKKRMPTLPLALRSSISLCVTQLFDTVLFTLLGLYGLGFALFDIILVSYLVKLTVILIFLLTTFKIRSKAADEV